jgi:hypothetical protein
MRMQAAKILRGLVALVVYGVVMAATYYVHARFFKVNVVFYGAIFDAVLAAAITLAVLHFARGIASFNPYERIQLVAIWLLCGYVFAISIPTVIARSLSFYFLEKLQQRGGEIPLAQFERVFTQEYAREQQVVDVRLTEQEASGTIAIVDGCVKLTERGQRLARLSSFFRANLLPKQRLVRGKYSDALTDPFRDSEVGGGGYECRRTAEAGERT